MESKIIFRNGIASNNGGTKLTICLNCMKEFERHSAEKQLKCVTSLISTSIELNGRDKTLESIKHNQTLIRIYNSVIEEEDKQHEKNKK